MTSLRRLHRFIVLLLLTSADVVDAFGIQKSKLIRRSSQLYANAASGEPTTGRREALVWSGISLASLLLGGSPANAEEPKTILITGSSSGIGLEAAKFLADKGHTLVLANRSEKRSAETVDKIRSYTSAGTLLPCACDLGSLTSIEKFVRDLPVKSLDISCLNAGLTLNYDDMNIQRTEDGFEITVGVNHFGHFYLNHLLMPKIDPNGKIVVTASGVHDPDSPGGAQGVPASLGNMEGLERDGKNCEMIDGQPYNPDKAYKDSKVSRLTIDFSRVPFCRHRDVEFIEFFLSSPALQCSVHEGTATAVKRQRCDKRDQRQFF